MLLELTGIINESSADRTVKNGTTTGRSSPSPAACSPDDARAVQHLMFGKRLSLNSAKRGVQPSTIAGGIGISGTVLNEIDARRASREERAASLLPFRPASAGIM